MSSSTRRRTAALPLLAASLLAFAAAPALADRDTEKRPGGESSELREALDTFSAPRTAPGASINPLAFAAAATAADAVAPVDATTWQELGPYNYVADNRNYLSQPFSNSGSGAGANTGRITALALAPDGSVFAGGAGGGVWRAADSAHQNWTPLFDGQQTTAIGALAVAGNAQSYTVYAGTGEANFNQDAYAGVGILKSTDKGATWSRAGGTELLGATIYKIVPNGSDVLAATNHGLYRLAAGASTWAKVLGDADTGSLPNVQVRNSVTDVAVRPGTGGKEVVAVRGWRAGATTNGLYVSRDGGATFSGPLNPQGYVSPKAQGRATIAYSADGRRLYAMVQDAGAFNTGAGNTILEGIYLSKDDVNGPFNQVASPANLQNSGSAMKPGDIGHGYQPGVQSWYNQFLTVDPANPDHVYAGLEEVYESGDAGRSWTAAAPYWNLTLKCFVLAADDFGACPNTTHSDQHAAVVGNGTLWVGNDGGVFSRPTSVSTAGGGWTDHNARLGTLQFYYAESGRLGDQIAYWGGLQDNGTAKLIPGASKFTPTEASQPFGGDGGDTVVDPANADNVITEYTNLDTATTVDGGRNWVDIRPPDPSPLFIAPVTADRGNLGDVYAGGEFLWKSSKGFATRSSDWTQAFDTGAGHSITAFDVVGGKGYAAWCGPCQPGYTSESGFKRGLIANTGSGWKQLDLAPNVPLRYITGVAVDDQADPSGRTAYVSISGYARHWFVGPEDPGVGHVYRTTDGGATWTDVSTGLVDAPANDVLVKDGHVVVATDVGVFTAAVGSSTWRAVGNGLPNVIVGDLSLTPNGDILAATHGRGLWKIPASALS